MSNDYQGARWLKVDLHVHTPFDGEKRFGEDVAGAIEAFGKERPERLIGIAERFLDACDDSALDVVAITDHNSIDGYRLLAPLFDQLLQTGRRPMRILPGVELNVGENVPIHCLAVFAKDTPAESIDRLITLVFGSRDRFARNGQPNPSACSLADFLAQLYDYCRPHSGERSLDFVLLPAHADGHSGIGKELGATRSEAPGLWADQKGELRTRAITRRDWHGFQTSVEYGRLSQGLRDLLAQWVALREGGDWQQMSPEKRKAYRDRRHWPLIQCSDPNRYEAIGTKYSWMKMAVADVEGIRLALLDPASRLRGMTDGAPLMEHPTIESIRVRNGKHVEDLQIHLSPSLNALIGGRGSGKSTLVEYVRWSLGRDRRDDLGSLHDRVSSLLCKPSKTSARGTFCDGFSVETCLRVEGRRYTVRRVLNEEPTARRDDDGAVVDVRTLLRPRVFSQRQIAGIAEDPSAIRAELDEIVGPAAREKFESERRVVHDEIATLQRRRDSLRGRLAMEPAKRTELGTLVDKITALEGAGRQELLDRFERFKKQRAWLAAVGKSLREQAAQLRAWAGAIGSAEAQLPRLPAFEGDPHLDFLQNVEGAARGRLRDAAGSLERSAEALTASIEPAPAAAFDAAERAVLADYEALCAELAAKNVDFTQHAALSTKRKDLEEELGAFRSAESTLQQTLLALDEQRQRLVELHRARHARRATEAAQLLARGADIDLQIEAFGDRRDLASFADAALRGSGFREGDWDSIEEFVFGAGSCEVPARLQKLADAWRQDVHEARKRGRPMDASESRAVSLLSTLQPCGHFLKSMLKTDPSLFDGLERFLPEDAVRARFQQSGQWKSIEVGSLGQRATAILGLVLSAGNHPLVIDQPEDDLDNHYIYDVVVELLRQRKFERQIVVATHNANVPVNGDAELIVALEMVERAVQPVALGSIDRGTVKEQVSDIMEGSAEAFRLRRERYGY